VSEADLQALYPFLHGEGADPGKLRAALLHSIAQKARESRDASGARLSPKWSGV